MALSIEEITTVRRFLTRAQLTGAEVPAFNQAVAALERETVALVAAAQAGKPAKSGEPPK